MNHALGWIDQLGESINGVEGLLPHISVEIVCCIFEVDFSCFVWYPSAWRIAEKGNNIDG